MSHRPAIVWFRDDLRVADNPALAAAAERGPVVPVYIRDPGPGGDWAPGAASDWWLHHSLLALRAELRGLGGDLVIRRGDSLGELRKVIRAAGAGAVFANRRYCPGEVEADVNIEADLAEAGVAVRTFRGNLLFEPEDIFTKQGHPYRVFTPFWRAAAKLDEPAEPLAAPSRLLPAPQGVASLEIDQLGLLPANNWAEQIAAEWRPGAAGAQARLDRFLDDALADYKSDRDRPDRRGVSMLSPHLHFGEISPRQVWHAVRCRQSKSHGGPLAESADVFLAEIGWREFAHHLLWHFPHTADEPLRPEFADFPWADDPAALAAWQAGRTGYPIVDAGMRQLWAIGWMHNRVRMIAASFLVKDLRLPWQSGARWFWDTLVDADLANNTLGWQWSAGCGADAAPYFRVFNPVTQGERFDPAGDYVRAWVPELADLPTRWIHKPWDAPPDVLADAGVTLGETYPHPIVDHAEARKAALAAFERIKKK